MVILFRQTKKFINKQKSYMVLFFLLVASFLLLNSPASGATLLFSTYVGGGIRDIATDRKSNIYVTGGTQSSNLPTTAGAYDRTHNGDSDVFVMKFSPNGQLIWSTYLGGPGHDRAYAIAVDGQGFVYLTGRAGPGFPTTAGSFQPVYQGSKVSLYGNQNAFVAKLSPDGSKLVFASYFGTIDGIRDLALDQNGNIYVASGYNPEQFKPLPGSWFSNAYKKASQGKDCLVAKISNDGSRVIWATYFGGSGTDAATGSIKVDPQGRPILLSFTNSSDLPTTPGAYDRTFVGVWDMFLAKFTEDGSGLVYATYFGGSDTEFTETHGLAIDAAGNAIIAATTKSTNLPTTPGAYQRTYGGSGGKGNYPGDGFVAKISANGSSLLAATYLGGTSGEGLEGVAVDRNGDVYVSGATYSTDFPVTADAVQMRNKGQADVFVAKLSADLTRLLYSTYMGGSGLDLGRALGIDSHGNFFVGGELNSSDWPIKNGSQTSHGGGGMLAAFVSNGGTAPATRPGSAGSHSR